MYIHTYVHILKNLHVEKAEQARTSFIPDTVALNMQQTTDSAYICT